VRRARALYLAMGGIQETLARMGPSVEGDEEEENRWQPNGSPNVLEYETGEVVVVVEEETAKVSLNAVSGDALKDLLEEAGADPEEVDRLADVLADFIDSDDLTNLDGAEESDYEAMGLSYGPFNGPLLAIDQLLLVPGFTPELFYGYGQPAAPFEKEKYEKYRDLPWPGQDSLFQIGTVYGSNAEFSGDEDEEDDLLGDESGAWEEEEEEEEEVPWAPNGIYRILACAKCRAGPPPVLLCMIVQYTPNKKPGYEILFRKIL